MNPFLKELGCPLYFPLPNSILKRNNLVTFIWNGGRVTFATDADNYTVQVTGKRYTTSNLVEAAETFKKWWHGK